MEILFFKLLNLHSQFLSPALCTPLSSALHCAHFPKCGEILQPNLTTTTVTPVFDLEMTTYFWIVFSGMDCFSWKHVSLDSNVVAVDDH